MNRLSNTLRKPITMKLFGREVGVPVILLLLVLSLVAGIFLTRHLLLNDEWRTFIHEKYDFSIGHPAIWSAEEYGDHGSRGLKHLRAQVFSPIGSSATVLIRQDPMENPELEDAVEWGQKIIAERNPHDITPLQATRVGYGNYPALTQTYEYRSFVLTGHTKVVYVVTADSAFMLEFTGRQSRFENSEEIFDRMLASFRFVNGGAD